MGFFGRGKNKIQGVYGQRACYDSYILDKDPDSAYYISADLYYKITGEFYKKVMDEILLNSRTFKLPFRMGTLRVCKTKVRLKKLDGNCVDWPITVELGKTIYHLNEHSGGYRYYFYWYKERSLIPNLFFYRLIMSRTNKRRLAKLIKTNKYDYYEK